MPDHSSPILKTLTVCLALLVALVGPAGVLAQGPSEAGSATAVTVLRVQTPAYQLDALGLRVPGYGTNSIPGAPALPAWSTVVELPPTGEPVITVEDGAVQVLSSGQTLPAVPVPLPAAPSAPSRSAGGERVTAVQAVNRPDPTIYTADAFYPGSVVATDAPQWQAGRRLLPLRVFPFQYNPVAGTLRYYADLRVTVRVQGAGDRNQASGVPQGGFALRAQGTMNPAALPQAAGGSLRIRTGSRGLYRLTYDALVAVDPAVATADPATFAVYYLGARVDIQVVDHNDNGQFESGDLVVFYAEPYTGRYQTDNVCWFTYGGTGSPPMETRTVPQNTAAQLVTEITQTLHIENNVDYRSTYHRPRDADHWFDDVLYPTNATPITRDYTLALDDAVTGADKEVVLRAAVHGGTNQSRNPDQSMQIRLNSHDVGLYQLGGSGLYQWEGSTDNTVSAKVPATWLDASPNKISLVAALAQLPGLTYYWISPDYVELTYPATADVDGTDRIYIESVEPGANQVRVTGFTTGDAGVYDIRDPRHPVQIMTTDAQFSGGVYSLSFWDEDLPDLTYWLSTEAALLTPSIEADTPSSWATTDHAADYIAIVYHKTGDEHNLWDAIDPLLAHRADLLGDHFSIAKVDVQDIYDEFSYGLRDPEAIRSFLKYAYYFWNGGGGPPLPPTAPPQYVLLVGSGTYDFTGITTAWGDTKPNLIPPYLADVDPWNGEAPADNRYVSVDDPVNGVDDFLPEMHIGRISAQIPSQVTAAVDKIVAYEKTALAGDWQHRAIYVADDCANYAGDFQAFSDATRLNWLPAPYEDRTVYYGDPVACPESSYSTVSGMTTGISAEFNAGAFLVQWHGHGSIFRWGDTGAMFSSKTVPLLAANTVWPISFSYTCYTGYFIDTFKSGTYNTDQALGEALIMTPQRGSVADLSSSGAQLGSVLVMLNQGITQAIFRDATDRIGTAADAGKLYFWGQAPSFPNVIDTYTLFGDPATRLRLPPLISAASDTGSVVKISWKHVPQYTTYKIYRSLRPYFNPDDGDAELAGTVAAPASGTEVVFYDNQGAIGNADLNYFYVVRGVNAFNTAAVSNRAGEFDFALIPGG